ncbi:MAG: SDR family NAD(P)-dependent oxidoreductase [Chloroflexi bacterium]|nr:SDR family NAD(P)-dependent oxidoreductase [Chloroflexota bacterium]MDL1884640.1 SDR family oxidoreductase [Anaerolineae bacterium CFX8]
MRVDLSGQVALVTGAAHRVGKAIALELARRGVHILVHYGSSAAAATETVREIKSMGVDAFSVQADVSSQTGVETIFTALREHFGRLNILVNSAANFQKRDLLEVSLQDWQETINTNLTGPFLCTQAAAALMRQNDPSGGVIINILDKGALEPWPEYPHHSVSKAGLWMLTQVSAASLGPDIRVNAVIPGPVMKPAGANMSDEEWAKVGQRTPLRRTGTAEDVARAVAYLTSEDYLTGAVIHVNGGEHLW